MRRTSDRSSRNAFSRSLSGRRRPIRSRSFRPLPIRLEDRTLLSTVTWINSGGGDWDTPSNWSTNALPGPSDDVAINLPGITITHSSSASESVNSLTISSSDSSLALSNGSLTLATTSSIAGSLSISGSTLRTAVDLTVTGAITWIGGTIAGSGALDIAAGASFSATGAIFQNETLDGVELRNAGTASLSPGSDQRGLILLDGAGIDNQAGAGFSIVGDGIVRSDASATSFTNEGALSVDGADSVQPAFTQAAGGSTSLTGGSFSLSTATNAGTVTIASGTSLGVNTYNQTAGSTVLNAGTINGGTLSINGGALTGTGTINASVTSGGQVIPGGNGVAGTLAITGNYTQTATGTVLIDIGGTTAGTRYDQLGVSGVATLGGTINVTLINDFQPVLGNTFQPLTFASSTGDFGFYNGIVLGNRLLLDPALNPTNLTLTDQPAVTTATLAATPSPSVSGQPVTFTATVTVALPPTTIDPVPTGTVTFYADGTPIGTGTLAVVGDQDEAVSPPIATLSTAGHQITAAYTSGDSNFIPSPTATAQTQVVNQASTAATVSSSSFPSVFGQSVTFTATVSVVSPGSTAVAYPSGTVTFYDNGTAIRTGTLSVSSGQDQATFTTSNLSVAAHPITAAYTSGDANFYASATSGALNQVINKDSTTTTVTPSANPAFFGQSVTLTAAVAANPPGSGTPTGTIHFFDTTTSTDLGSFTATNGSAAVTTSSLPLGTQTITVTYGGDGNFLCSSKTLTITVQPSIFVLNQTASGALTLSGNAAINIPGIVFVDSGSKTAVSAAGNAQVTASAIDVVGGVQQTGTAAFHPTPTTNYGTVTDPLAGLPSPDPTGLTNYGSVKVSGNTQQPLCPGHLQPDQRLGQRQPDPRVRRLHHRGWRLHGHGQREHLGLGRDDLQRRQQLPEIRRELRRDHAQRQRVVQPDRRHVGHVRQHPVLPVAGEHAGAVLQRQRHGRDERDDLCRQRPALHER